MKQILHMALLTAALSSTMNAASLSFRGVFSTDDQVELFNFSVFSPATVEFLSLAYGGGTNAGGITIAPGGFDTLFTLFLSNGTEIGEHDDSNCAVDPVHARNGACLDACFRAFLTPGNYVLALTQSGNYPAGDLSSGFTQQGNGNFTCPPGFCDAFGGQSNGSYAVDIRNVAAPTPEPATNLLIGSAIFLAGSYLLCHKSIKQTS